MFINEYGSRNDPTIILLAPMMISGSDLYGQMSPFFHGSYHIISPDQGGHGKAGAYLSADEEYQTLRSFLLETGCADIELVYERLWGRRWLTGSFLTLRLWSVMHGLMAWRLRKAPVSQSGLSVRCIAPERKSPQN